MKYALESQTSYAAAIDNLPRLGGQQQRILQELLIAKVYGRTRDELEEFTGLSGNAVRPRVKELLEAGLIEETDRTRVTRSGSKATVLVAVSSGVESGVVIESQASAQGLGENPVATLDSGVELRSSSPRDAAPPGSFYAQEVWEAA